MSGLLARAGALFVAPADPVAVFVPPRARPPVVGVLGDAGDLLVVAGAEASALRRQTGAAFALVCVWAAPVRPAPAAPAAARAAGRLAREGLPARAAGSLCLVDGEAAREAMAALEAPVVLATGRRSAEVDALLGAANRLVLVPTADPALAELAAADLAALGRPVSVAEPPAGVLARQAARLGLAAASPATVEVPA